MATLSAADHPIIIDNMATPPEVIGTTTITYAKNAMDDKAWCRIFRPASSLAVDWHEIAGPEGPDAFTDTILSAPLGPGDVFEVGIFPRNNGPLAPDPDPLITLPVVAVLRGPEAVSLISDESGDSGGTWHGHGINARVDTTIALIAASRQPITIDGFGFPELTDAEGVPAKPLGISIRDHHVDLVGLWPGHHYFLTAILVDDRGNWEVLKTQEFDTHKRALTVKIPQMIIFNDGDSLTPGEAQFWFRVGQGTDPLSDLDVVEEFYMPTFDIDDWSKSGRPYNLGYAHVGQPESVEPGHHVWVSSWAREDDGWRGDEGAGDLIGHQLTFPVGRFQERSPTTLFGSTVRL